MSLSDLTSTELQELLRLIRERETLQARLAKVTASLAKFDAAPAPPAQPRSRKTARRAGGTLKDSVLHVLAEAGPGGLSIRQIATRAKAKEGSVSVWIYTTGKKIPGLKKIAPGRYTYQKG